MGASVKIIGPSSLHQYIVNIDFFVLVVWHYFLYKMFLNVDFQFFVFLNEFVHVYL